MGRMEPATVVFIVATALTVTVAVMVWRRRQVRGGLYFGLMMIAVAGWDLTSALEYLSRDFETKVFWSTVSYFFVGACAPFWLHYVLHHTEREHWLNARKTLLLWVIPVLSLVLAFTNDRHGLIWSDLGRIEDEFGLRVVYRHGAMVWALAFYSYGILVFCMFHLLAWARKAAPEFANQARTLVFASTIPWFGNILYLFGLFPLPGIDTTPLGFAAMGLVVGWSILRQGFLELAPIAYDKLFMILRIGVLVTDTEDRFILANPAAVRYLGLENLKAGDRLSGENMSFLNTADESGEEVCLTIRGREHWVDVHRTPLTDDSVRPAGSLYLLRDVTERRQREKVMEKMIEALEKSLSEIRQLQGLLPICSHCKKIRDDGGYWEHVEKYISDHTEAQFTHGICPECLTRYYGEDSMRDKS